MPRKLKKGIPDVARILRSRDRRAFDEGRAGERGAPAAISSIKVIAKETDDPDVVAATMAKPWCES